MSQQKEENQKKAEGGAKKDDAPAPVVLKLDMHCEGCVKKIKRAIRHFDGVEDVKTDVSANKLTVFGIVDPAKVRDKLSKETKKKVEIVSPQPRKGAGGCDKKAEGKPKKKADEKRPDEKKVQDGKPKESTVVLKTSLHSCDGCIRKIRKIILNLRGVESVSVDRAKDLVTVKGTMDAKELSSSFLKKTQRRIILMVSFGPF